MDTIKKSKKNISIILKRIIRENSFVFDIWMYGNFTDRTSDLDLIVVYKKTPSEIIFPVYVRKFIADGSVIYIDYRNRNDLFLFEDLKINSIKNNKKYNYTLSKEHLKFRSLSSFIERYYERRTLLNKKKIYNLNDTNLRNIKSIFFSYENFSNLYKDYSRQKNLKNLYSRYLQIRIKYNNKTLKKIYYKQYIKLLKNFDKDFFNYSFLTLDNTFKETKIFDHSLKLRKNLIFNYKMKNKRNFYKIPKIFFFIYLFYASQNLAISKRIMDSFDKKFVVKKKYFFEKIFPYSFIQYLKRKINFINKNYLVLKKQKFKTGLYRFSWYLNS